MKTLSVSQTESEEYNIYTISDRSMSGVQIELVQIRGWKLFPISIRLLCIVYRPKNTLLGGLCHSKA
ncbi:LOW QUALITY PROTEIN: hypothetical protein V1478_015506 [Vespula squamosa]|uniref:Uncharacterized protein n=1 Tax=Vespula squamosa TaxID=30214 RepID=A0ABD2A5B3_VESSQ